MEPNNARNLNSAKTFLDNIKPRGSTFIGKPIKAAIDQLKRQSNRLSTSIFLITDGEIWDGKVENVIQNLNSEMGQFQLQINTISLGDDYKADEMDKLAFAFGGRYLDIPNIENTEQEFGDFYDKVNNFFIESFKLIFYRILDINLQTIFRTTFS